MLIVHAVRSLNHDLTVQLNVAEDPGVVIDNDIHIANGVLSIPSPYERTLDLEMVNASG